ncbi:hypothetical protein ACJMK2_031980 [Sinanodonta woodiana]|uniref:Mitochondria-eating protein C-terminal domain-containing protein n=1 Tax=Sinanodonta woodiana TaxID=1069815 RepID=A0ABD3X2H6_SINWO
MNGPPDAAANDCRLHFDSTQFASYTRTGMYLKYVVWPAVYLYESGPIMKRGVAQGFNGEPEAKESAIVEKGEKSKNTFDTNYVDADHVYHGNKFNSGVLKR